MSLNKYLIYCCLIFFFSNSFYSQKDSLKTRKIILLSSSSALTASSLVYLNYAWYSKYNTGKFHFFNDNKEWLQMDKVGHAYTNYQITRLLIGAFDWAGYSKKNKHILGAGIGFGYQTVIEIFDGYSNGWGFSWGDFGSNALGSAMATSQSYFFNKQIFQLKYSYSQSGLAKYNPNLLGENFYTQILKDYNGQTYWLSFHPTFFIKNNTKIPKWINVSFGYSAYGMVGGHANNFLITDENGNVLKLDRERRFYFSFDIDLTQLKVKNKALKKVFSVINILKFPAPALQLSNKGLRAYALYY